MCLHTLDCVTYSERLHIIASSHVKVNVTFHIMPYRVLRTTPKELSTLNLAIFDSIEFNIDVSRKYSGRLQLMGAGYSTYLFIPVIMVMPMYFQRQQIVQSYRAIDNIIQVDFKARDCREPHEADVITDLTLLESILTCWTFRRHG